MDWIKKNYDQFLLVLASVALLSVAFLLIQRSKGFDERFTAAMVKGQPKKDVPALVLEPVDIAKQALEAPAQWKPSLENSFFLVPKRYVIDAATKTPKQIKDVAGVPDSLSGKTIPSQWLLDNALDPLNANITKEDTDKDGFLNEDEWRANPQTDPNNKDSHPPFVSKLFLVAWIKVPFRLLFNAIDGNPKKDKPEKMSFQINTVDLRQPTEFLSIGQTVRNTKFKLKKFEYKVIPDANAGDKDVSELTLVNTDTNEEIVLVKEQVKDSPDSFAQFDYQWPQPPVQIRVKKLQEFVLLPEKEKKYKLVDIKENEAVITLPSGENLTIIKDPRPKR